MRFLVDPIAACGDHHQGRGFRQHKTLSDAGPAVIWIRLPNTRRRDLLTWFGLALPNVVLALERGETLVEVV